MFGTKDFASIMMSVMFVSTFICVFYFTYAVHIERNVIKNQVESVVDDFVEDLAFLPQDMLDKMKQYTKSLKISGTGAEEADAKVEKANKEIFYNAIKIISISLVIGLLGITAASYYFKFSMIELLKKNSIILVLIALTEFIFLTFFGQNYMSADSNYVKYELINSIQNHVNN